MYSVTSGLHALKLGLQLLCENGHIKRKRANERTPE
jgi:hypothetical protein